MKIFEHLCRLIKNWQALGLFCLLSALAVFLDEPSATNAAGLVVVTLVLFWICRRNRQLKHFALYAGVASLCALFFFYQKNPVSEDLLNKKFTFKGVIEKLSVSDDGYTRLVVNLWKRLEPYQDQISGRIQLTIGQACGNDIEEGAPIEFETRLKRATSYLNPGVFDYRKYLARNNIWAKGFVEECWDISPDWTISTLRTVLIGRLYNLDKAGLVTPRFANTAMMVTLLTGARTLSQEQNKFIRDAGLSHLFAISGMQFGVMSFLIYWMISGVTALFPQIYLKYPRQKIAAVATVIFSLVFMRFTDGEASILRAGIMICTYLIAVILGTRTNLLYTILVSACVVLFIKPLELFSLSFQLSYLCVVMLAVILAPVLNHLNTKTWCGRLPKPVKYVFTLFVTSLTLQIFLMPLIIHDFGAYSPAGIFHNLWAVPYFDFVITPLSFAYFMVGIFSTKFSLMIAGVWNEALTGFLIVLQHLNVTTKVLTNLPMPHVSHVMIFYITLIAYAVSRQWRVLLVGISILFLALGFTYYQNFLSYDLRITQIDVGQGDAVLLQSRDKNVLIDTGGSAYLDIGKMAVLPFLKHLWITKLDAVIITHADIDHYGGLTTLKEALPIGEVWVNGFTTKDNSYLKLIDDLKSENISIKVAKAGDEYVLGHGDALRVLSPAQDLSLADTDNDHSIVMKLGDKNFTGLFTGDISKMTERALLTALGHELDVDYLKLPHHGSKTSSSADFLEATSPNLVTIGVGRPSRFGHPHRDVVKRLEALSPKPEIYRTDHHGAITVTVNNNKILVETMVK